MAMMEDCRSSDRGSIPRGTGLRRLAEWTKAPVWSTGDHFDDPWVRIPYLLCIFIFNWRGDRAVERGALKLHFSIKIIKIILCINVKYVTKNSKQ